CLFVVVARRRPLSTLFPSRRSSDLVGFRHVCGLVPPTPARGGAGGAGLRRHGRRRCGAPAPAEARAPPPAPRPERRFPQGRPLGDRKSTRLNSSHEWISYAVFCLKK